MKNLARERATQIEEMPHRFEALPTREGCELCGAGERDPRHVSWQRMDLASRESAASQSFRELGS